MFNFEIVKVRCAFQPENIMLLNKNKKKVSLIDFGLSRKLQEGDVVRELMGTPEFVGKLLR